MTVNPNPLPPHILAQWHPTLNGDIDPATITAGKNVKYWWLCENGHHFPSTPNNRCNKNRGCKYCKNKAVWPGFNDLATTFPQLATQWHPTKNGNLTPQDVAAGQTVIVTWLCDKGHNWEEKPYVRTRNAPEYISGCPYCAGQRVWAGYNDLATTHPELAAQWHPTKNGELTPQQVSRGYRQKVWWLGECGHEWQARPNNRTNTEHPSGCSVCAARTIVPGVNDLATLYPEIAAQWHPTKNTKKPTEVAGKAKDYAWWLCDKGHEWPARIYSRTKRGCEKCSVTQMVSAAEKQLADSIRELGYSIKQSDRSVLKTHEIDIYIPDLKTAIEFNGTYWHTEANGKHSAYHHDKWDKCLNLGINLIQIWEDDWRSNTHQVMVDLQSRLDNKNYSLSAVKATSEEARNFAINQDLDFPEKSNIYLKIVNDKNLEIVGIVALTKKSNSIQVQKLTTFINRNNCLAKTIEYIEQNYPGNSIRILDIHETSDQTMLEKLGFTPEVEIQPDYMILSNGKRKSKTSTTDTPEKRIWDAGKTFWKKS